ncbi:MAG: hypothetical protein A2051_03450 [Desulfovibrionales bacterium GWA2_65_9]|nr:MAG: hypothetical protein A2051_03450 [Desulfovibrionales bacterium GWA2_65_9]
MPQKHSVLVLPCVFLTLLLMLACAPRAALAGALEDAKAGEAALNRRDYREAIRLYTQALAPGNLTYQSQAVILNSRGNAYSGMRLYEQAVLDYDQALRLTPEDYALYFNRGLVFMTQGRFDLGARDFEKVISLKPGHADAYFNLGNAYGKLGQNDRAVRQFTHVITLKSDADGAYYNRGVAYQALRQYELAIRDYDHVLQRKPNFEDAIRNRAISLRLLKDKSNPPVLMTPEIAKMEVGKHPGKSFVVEPTGEYATIDNNPMLLLTQKLLGTYSQENDPLIGQIMKTPEDYQPPVLFALAKVLYKRGQFDDAVYWMHAGLLRICQDAAVSTDPSVHSAIGKMILMMPQDLLKRQFDDAAKLNSIMERIVKWDEATPYKYDRRWIAHSGVASIARSMSNSTQAGPLLVPREQWDALAQKTRVEYRKLVFGLMDTLQKQKQAK